MKSSQHAIVIGAGFGGIAASLRMKALGYDVTLIDKLSRLGGRAQVYHRQGFTFDAGPTVITAPFLFEELFSLFNKKLSDYIEFLPLDLWYRFIFHDQRTFEYGKDLEKTLNEISKFNPADREGYLNLLKFSEKIYQVGFTQLAHRPFHRFSQMLKILPSMLRLKSYKSVYQLVAGFIQNDYLRKAFTISPLLIGGNPFDTTSIYSLILFLERQGNIHFPKGGTGALVNALERLMKEEKINILLNTTVTNIEVTNQKVKSVHLSNGASIEADVVVANGDPSYTYKHLLKSASHKWTDSKVNKLKYSMGLYVLYFGTKVKYPQVAHHTIIMGNSYRELLADIFNHGPLSDDVSLYLHRPTATDTTLAPEGCDTFYVLAPVPNLKANIDWNVKGKYYRDLILQILEEKGMENLRQNLAVDFFVTPEHFKSEYLSEFGTGFSIAPILTQSAYFRFHNRSEDIASLYFVGAGTHPGAGIPGVLSSAKVLEEIHQEQGYL